MHRLLVSPHHADQAARLGIAVDSDGVSILALSEADATADASLLAESGCPAFVDPPVPTQDAHGADEAHLAMDPAAARLFLERHVRDRGARGPHTHTGLMDAMASLWPNAYAALLHHPGLDALDFPDTYRVAPLDDPTASKAFDLVQQGGCCGVFEDTIEVDGRAFRVGCNHGH